ncbi:MAG: transcription termination/antitermination protein NusA [Clostridia bacterium]|nr:transcription termination/antitermination protein NusA [Clostridia bacterium]
MNKEFFEAVALMEKEKGIQADYLYDKISEAIVKAVRRDYNNKDVVACDIDPEAQTMRVYIHLNIVDEITDWDTDILVIDAQEYRADAKAGETLEIDLDTMKFGRIAAQTAKHVIRQGIKDAERGQVIRDFQSKTQDLVSAKVSRIDPITGNVTLEIGKGTAVLPKGEQVPGETFTEGELVKVYISEVKDTERGPRVMISRTHKGLVKRLFEQEVPEIYDGIVTIHSISREAGVRTKMAVSSSDENVDPIGACIGQRGARVNNIVEVLGGEKIDIVKYSDDPAEFVAASLAPANVLSVEILNADEKKCQATVPDHQLSLAIGNKGLNAKLAAKLTGWNIDIKPESGFYEG